jgi:predicted nucleotidyltransferase
MDAVLSETLRKSLAPWTATIKAAFVYGSIARGTDLAESDIDLMVIGDGLNYSDLYTTLQNVECAVGRTVSPIFLSMSDWRRKASEKDSFVSKVNALPKIFVFGSEQDLQLVTS